MAFCVCVVNIAAPSSWSRSAARSAGSAPPVVQSAWPRRRRFLLRKCFPSVRCASGCCHCRLHCARQVPAPSAALLQGLAQRIAERIGRKLERRGLIERDMENAWLASDGAGVPGRSCSRCRRCRPQHCLRPSSKEIIAVPRKPVGSHCMRASTFSSISARSWNDCVAT